MEKWKIKAIAANLNLSLEALAEKTGLDASHLKQVSAGNTRMLAEDLVAICNFTGMNYNQIETNYKN